MTASVSFDSKSGNNVIMLHFDGTFRKPKTMHYQHKFNLSFNIVGDYLFISHIKSKIIMRQSISKLRELAEKQDNYEEGSILTLDFVPEKVDLTQLIDQSISDNAELVKIDNLCFQAKHALKCGSNSSTQL